MFSLSEIKDIRRKYKFDENGDIKLNGKEEAKDPSEMNLEEKSYIESGLFLYRKVKCNKEDCIEKLTDEEFLEQLQTKFVLEALSKREYKAYVFGSKDDGKIEFIIWKSILEKDAGAITYFNRVLAENGKRLQIFQRNEIKGLELGIKYDLVDDNKGKFLQSLNPNNPLYIQKHKTKELTKEQKEARREFVDNLMQSYRQCEKDINYEERAKREESNMRFVLDTVEMDSSFEILPRSAFKQIMNLLYAAENLSLDGQKDYLEALIDKTEISNFLLDLKRNKILDKIEERIKQKDDENRGLHKPTHGERAIRYANEVIEEQPDAVKMVKKALSGDQTFVVEKGNMQDLKRAYLIEIVAKIQYKDTNRLTDEKENKILQIDYGKNYGNR